MTTFDQESASCGSTTSADAKAGGEVPAGSSAFTVFFDGRFWVGVLERRDGPGAGQVRAVRVVFGPEPTNAELYEWVQYAGNGVCARLDDAGAVEDSVRASGGVKRNPKRAQREAALAAREPSVSTAAQAAMKADQEARGRSQGAARRDQYWATAEESRLKKRQKAKARHRGH